MKLIKPMLAFSAALLLSATAWAAPEDADSAAMSGSQGGVTVYDFEDDDVDGEVLSPEGANLSSRGRSKHASMITIRPHFIAELIKMANDI
ncbi:hypothetical protein PPSIR1_33978 [Plesiocystis pacifica SIR-1]|uniref:Uncharacterized protein n=1 Tax=Plesiocystis pacifica SIR-1 TaxID=391625 RepID=A6GIF2_9BACT|nr:hypothetical protein [Plesiocystis pacifica]EDM74363.1 hypothetical protein PPSIR1_33978 [Plesiocystis pacifica SIR-1]